MVRSKTEDIKEKTEESCDIQDEKFNDYINGILSILENNVVN
jgi:hypothetical protein